MKARTKQTLALAGLALLLLFFAAIATGWLDKLAGNCWDQYSTEQQAIKNCEGK